MHKALRIASLLSLVLLIAPSIIYLAGKMSIEQVKVVMLIATILWFATATPIMWKGQRQQEPEKEEVIVP